MNRSLNFKLKELYNNITTNDFYKEIYNKFIYLPIKNNIQLIIKYYPLPECSYDIIFDPLNSKCYYQIDNINNDHVYNPEIIKNSDINGKPYIGYFRKNNHLENMFKEDYYNFITINDYTFGTKNITLPNKNINPIPFFIWRDYIVCPTLDPVHKNHIIIVSKDMHRAQEFYFPTSDFNVLRDMFEFADMTGQYVYNSIELGSIPEKVHFHTSNEIPPIDNITKMANSPIYNDNMIKMYEIDELCHKCYYFEIEKDGIERFIDILPSILYNSLFDGGYKYIAQVFICPRTSYEFKRAVITFRKVSIANIEPVDGKFKEEYYNELFGEKIELCYGKYIGMKGNLRFNILGYEPIQYNYTNNPIEVIENNELRRIKEYCLSHTHSKLKDYCKVFSFNNLFKENIKILFIKNKVSQRIYNNIINKPPIYEIKDIKIMYNVDESFVGIHNNNVYFFELTENIDLNNYIQLYTYFPQYNSKIYAIVEYNKKQYFVKKSVISNFEEFVNLKPNYKYSLNNNLLYQLELYYKKFHIIYTDMTKTDILVKKQKFMKKITTQNDMINYTTLDMNNIIPVFTNLHKFKRGTYAEFKQSIETLKNIINKDSLSLSLSPSFKLNNNMIQYITFCCNTSIENIIAKLQVDNSIVKYLDRFKTYIIPKYTRIVSGTKTFDLYTDFNTLTDISWYTKTGQSTWFTSNFDLSTILPEESGYKYITHKGIGGSNSDWYLGTNPTSMGRHMIFELNKDCKFKFLSFDLIERIKIHINIIILLINMFIPNKYKLFQINNNDSELKQHPLYKDLELNKIKEDSIVVFICEVLKYYNMIDFDGYIGIDFMNKIRLYGKEGKTTVEYILFNPTDAKLLSIFYYDFYNSKYLLFRNINDWNDYLKNNISITQNVVSNFKQQGDVIDILNYKEIDEYYIENLNFIISDMLILKNNDFLNGNNKTVVFSKNLIE